MERANASFRFLAPSTKRRSSRCFFAQLERFGRLRVPTFRSHPPRVLEKVIHEKATLVLNAPIWPAQSWFPILLDLMCDHPFHLPLVSDILTSPDGCPRPLVLTGGLRLAAWRLSGDWSLRKAFQNERSRSCSRRSVDRQGRLTTLPGASGPDGAQSGTPLRFRELPVRF